MCAHTHRCHMHVHMHMPHAPSRRAHGQTHTHTRLDWRCEARQQRRARRRADGARARRERREPTRAVGAYANGGSGNQCNGHRCQEQQRQTLSARRWSSSRISALLLCEHALLRCGGGHGAEVLKVDDIDWHLAHNDGHGNVSLCVVAHCRTSRTVLAGTDTGVCARGSPLY